MFFQRFISLNIGAMFAISQPSGYVPISMISAAYSEANSIAVSLKM